MKERRSEFLLLSLWESESSIRAFAGPDIDKAVYNFAGDKEFLIELESEVAHYEILSAISSGEPALCPDGKS
jgi:heme-degrading monooxygenase HmoA